MGSITQPDQLDLTQHLQERDAHFDIDHCHKSKIRCAAEVQMYNTGISEHADFWWKEAEAQRSRRPKSEAHP